MIKSECATPAPACQLPEQLVLACDDETDLALIGQALADDRLALLVDRALAVATWGHVFRPGLRRRTRGVANHA